MPQETPRLNVVEKIESRDSTMAYDSKCVNGLVEQGVTALHAVKRGGLAVAFQGTAGVGQGLDNYLNVLYSISGDTLNQFQASSTVPVDIQPNASFGARDGAALAGFLGKLWVIGGANAAGLLGDSWTSVDGINWGPAGGNPPSARTGAKAIVLNNVLYVMGGQDAGANYLRDVWSTPDGLTWTQILVSAPWGGRADFELLLYGNQIYLAAGQGQGTPTTYSPDPGLWHDVWTSPDGIAWTAQNTSCPWIGRRRFGFYSVGSTFYVLGGIVSVNQYTLFNTSVTDLWSSIDQGVTWVRVNSNAFGVAGCPMLPATIITSPGSGGMYGIPVTVTNGAGGTGAAAYAYVVGDDDTYDYEWCSGYDVDSVVFTTPGTGYTTACTFTVPSQGVAIPAIGYGFLDGSAVSGCRGGEVVFDNGLYYYFTTFINGAQANEIWTSPDGVTWTLKLSNPGYASRSMQVIVYGNMWIIGGSTSGTTFYNDVWSLSSGASMFALTPTVAGEFYNFNQTATSIATPLMVFKSAHQGYTFNASLGTLTKITDADYPAVTVYGLVYLDTTFYVMDPQGRIWGSALNDPTTWTALNEIALQNEPNGGVGIAKVGTYLLALGQWSCEFFYDNANAGPGSPLSANTTLAFQIGCAAGRSIVEMQGSVIWIGQTVTEGAKVYIMQGYTPVIISTPYIDRILQADPLTLVESFATSHFGHSLYVLTLGTTGVTLVYDFLSQFWYTWTSSTQAASVALTALSIGPYFTSSSALVTASTAPAQHGLQDGNPVNVLNVPQTQYNGAYNVTVLDAFTVQYQIAAPGTAQTNGLIQGYSVGPYLAVAGAELFDNCYVQDPVNGKVYAVVYNTGGDYGNPIDFNIVTPNWDGGIMREKYVTRASIVGDRTASNVLIRHSESDYTTWSKYRSVNMQAAWPFISALGKINRTVFQLRHTAFVPQRFEALEIELETGV